MTIVDAGEPRGATSNGRGIAPLTETVEWCLARIEADKRAYTVVYDDAARANALSLTRSDENTKRLPLYGLLVTVKDNMDVAGETTRAGASALSDQPPATLDAKVVRKLRDAGAIVVAKTHMPELALSALGVGGDAPPPNPLDPDRVPGGSSSGAAVSVASGNVDAALGTDTGGSVVLPAALCGLVGYKPTAARVPLDGVVPLSRHLDSIGPIAHNLEMCRRVAQSIVTGLQPKTPLEDLSRFRLAVPTNYVLDELDDVVARAFERALSVLSARGARIEEVQWNDLDIIPEVYRDGGFSMPELYSWLRRRGLTDHSERFDARAWARVSVGARALATDMLDRLAVRQQLVQAGASWMHNFDGVLMPTHAIIAPRFSEIEIDTEYSRLNGLMMRNSRVANVFDLCAITLPLKPSRALAVGLTLMAPAGADEHLLNISSVLEATLQERG